MEISNEKSKIMVTSRRNDNEDNAEIAIDGKQLEAVKEKLSMKM